MAKTKPAHICEVRIHFSIPANTGDLTRINADHPNVENLYDELIEHILSMSRASEIILGMCAMAVFSYSDIPDMAVHLKMDSLQVQNMVEMYKIKADDL